MNWLVRARGAVFLMIVAAVMAGCDTTTADEHLTNAKDYVADGELPSAVIELRNALQKQPDLAEARLLLGEAHLDRGDYPSALKEFERALDLGLDTDRVRAGLLRSKVQLGRYNEVLGELEGQGELAPEFAVILGDAYLAANDLKRARAMYRQAPERADAQLGLGRAAWREDAVDQASEHLQRAVELDPKLAESWLSIGELELASGNHGAATAAFANAAEQPAGRVLGHIGLTRTALVQGNLDSAASEVARLLKLAPDMPMAHYLDGLVRFEQQDIAGAESAIRKVRQAAPDHAPSLFLMGAIKYRQGELAQAEENLARYVSRNPDNPSAIKLLASVRFEDGRYAPVVELLEPLRRNSADPQILAMYGAAQLRLGEAAEAADALEAAVALAPDMAPFRNQLALSLLASGDQSRAEAELASAIDVDGDQFQSDYLLAMLRMRDRDWPGASEAIEALIEKNPDSPIGYNLRGAVALAQERHQPALEAFETALERNAAFFPAVQNLARLHARLEQPQQAIARYEAFVAEQPGHERALVALAELALSNGDDKAAADYLQRAVEADSAHTLSRLALARLRLRTGQLADASGLVDEALQQTPDQPDLLILRGEIDLRSNDLESARRAAERLQTNLANYPDNARLHLALGHLQARTGQSEPARRNLQRALDLGNINTALALQTLAQLDLRAGDLMDARVRLDQLLAGDQPDKTTRMLQAEVLLAEDNEAQARELLDSLAEQGLRTAVMRLASLDLAAGAASDASARLQNWLEKQPGDQGATLLLADALMRFDTDRALKLYETLADSGNPVVLNNLAWLYMEKGDSRAVDLAQRASAAAPDNPDILDTLGWVLLQNGQVQEALTQLRRSVQLNPDNPSTQYHLGVALQQAERPAEARAALNRALTFEAFPERQAAQQALESLPL